MLPSKGQCKSSVTPFLDITMIGGIDETCGCATNKSAPTCARMSRDVWGEAQKDVHLTLLPKLRPADSTLNFRRPAFGPSYVLLSSAWQLSVVLRSCCHPGPASCSMWKAYWANPLPDCATTSTDYTAMRVYFPAPNCLLGSHPTRQGHKRSKYFTTHSQIALLRQNTA